MSDPENTRLAPLILSAAVFILAVLIVAGAVIPRLYDGPESAGEFGDMFGVANALFSGLAFLGVIAAILLQKHELALQREELAQTRQELAGQRHQLELQNATFRQQAFDTSFFQMLDLHHQIVNGIDTSAQGNPLSGRDCFVRFYERLQSVILSEEFAESRQTLEGADGAYMKLYASIQPDVGHYFRNLYNIVKFVDRSSVEDQRFYTNLVRAQLSSHELLLLFYNCITALGRDKFKPLVERYALLKNMPAHQLFDRNHLEWYEFDAYG